MKAPRALPAGTSRPPFAARRRGFLAAGFAAAFTLGANALAQPQAASAAEDRRARESTSRNLVTTMTHVNDALKVVRALQADPRFGPLLPQVRGVFLLPSYTRVAAGVGGGGGAGVFLAKKGDGSWSDPAFYHVGTLSAGLQVGMESGPAALLLTTPKAVDQFRKTSSFALGADAGLTIVNWATSASAETGDVVIWSANKGLFGNAAAVSISDVRYSRAQNEAYYGRPVLPQEVIEGRVTNTKANELRQALAAGAPKGTVQGAAAAPAQ